MSKYQVDSEELLSAYLKTGTKMVLAFLVFYFLLVFIRRFLVFMLRKIVAGRHKGILPAMLNVVSMTGPAFNFVTAAFITSYFFYLPYSLKQAITTMFIIVSAFYVVIFVEHILSLGICSLISHYKSKNISPNIISFINNFTRAGLWILAIVIILQNFGFNLSTLVGGLGIAGIAVAFALNNILSDVFAYFAINLDQPFKIGDYIGIDNVSGTVRHIGIKTTRIVSLEGEELVINNKELSGARIHNYAAIQERRVVLKLRFTNNVDLEKLTSLEKYLQEFFVGIDKTRFYLAKLTGFDDFGLKFEIVYYVLGADYNLHMDVRQRVCLEILNYCKLHNLEMAFADNILIKKNAS